MKSLLSWERGLKSIVNDCLSSPVSAAPLVGAWIEINVKYYIKCIKRSLLSWERGLKLPVSHVVGLLFSSLLSWERGLKFKYSSSYSHSSVSLLSWERGLKYGIKAVTKSVGNGRSSRGSVD